MGEKNMKKPEIIVFAGPNGSGKSTVTALAKTIGVYVNADDIKKAVNCSDLEAAEQAEKLRWGLVNSKSDFTFETVLSTDRNLKLLKCARDNGYFIRCYYILTADPDINVQRVRIRVQAGGHDVPVEKVRNRYYRSLGLLPELIKVCDICHIYDNSSDAPVRIFKKRKEANFFWPNNYWEMPAIEKLTGIKSK